MPIPTEVQQAFTKLELVRSVLTVTMETLLNAHALAQGAIDDIKTYLEQQRPQ